MNVSFIDACKRYIELEGIPWATVSRKTGISYERLRGLRAGRVEVTLEEFIRLGRYCKLDCAKFIQQEISMDGTRAS